jgi:hypothetical protein
VPGVGVDLLKINARGHMSDNTWSFGIYLGLAPNGGVDGTNIGALTTAIEPSFSTYATFCANHVWSSLTQYEGITAYHIPSGHTVSDLTGVKDVTPIVGSQSSPMPAFCSMVQSLRSVFSSRTQRGRIYVPWTGGGVSSNGQTNQTMCDNMSGATKALLDALNALDLSAHGVTSQTVEVVSFTRGLTTPVDHVIVDSIPDTQHRRQDKVAPIAKSVAVLA